MNNPSLNFKNAIGLVCLSLLIGLSISLGLNFLPPAVGQKTFGSVNLVSDRNYIDAIGTVAAPATLTSSYVTSSAMKVAGLSNLVLAGSYTPKSYGSLLYLQIERSIDNGQTYHPYDVLGPATDRVNVYTNGFTTSSAGVPFQIPVTASSTSGTPMLFSFDNTMAADYVRISAKESTTSTAGTVYVQLLSTNH